MSDIKENEIPEIKVREEKLNFSRVSKYFLIVSCFIILVLPSIAVIIMKRKYNKHDEHIANQHEVLKIHEPRVFAGNILLITTYIVTLGCIGIIAAKNYKIVKQERSTYNILIPFDTYRSQLKSQRAILIINAILMVLGIGEAVFNLTNLADDVVVLINNNTDYIELIVSIFENGIKCIYHLCLLVFVMHHRKYEHMLKCLIVRIFLYSLSFSCLIQWFFILLEEIDFERRYEKHHDNSTLPYSNNDKKIESFKKVEKFLFPLGIEFRISMFIELFPIPLPESREELVFVKKASDKLHLYFHKVIHISKNITQTKQIKYYVQASEKDDNDIFYRKKSYNHSMVGHFCMFFSLLTSIIVVSISIVIIFFQDSNLGKNCGLVLLTSEISESLIMIFSFIYLIFLFMKIKYKNIPKNDVNKKDVKVDVKKFEKKFDFIVLIISEIVLILYCALVANGSIRFLKSDHKICKDGNKKYIIISFAIIASTVSIVQSIAQTIFIYIFESNSKIHRSYVKILILINFGIWIFDTFSAIKHETSSIQRQEYGKELWENLCIILIPLSIFYRIHSVIVLIKLNAKTYNLFDVLTKH